MSADLREGLKRYLPDDPREKLASCSVGIAGAGGLGSNAALMLARSGIEKMFLADCDEVDASNLNRQQFWPRHIGMKKVDALREILLELNPHMRIETFDGKIDSANMADIISKEKVWIEALDSAELKGQFATMASAKADFVVAASGLCGIGGEPLKRKRLGNLLIVGDYRTGLDRANPFAPRVTQAAALMADGVLEYFLNS